MIYPEPSGGLSEPKDKHTETRKFVYFTLLWKQKSTVPSTLPKKKGRHFWENDLGPEHKY